MILADLKQETFTLIPYFYDGVPVILRHRSRKKKTSFDPYRVILSILDLLGVIYDMRKCFYHLLSLVSSVRHRNGKSGTVPIFMETTIVGMRVVVDRQKAK